MPKVVIPTYPDALTVKFWNKAKGILARMKKMETGITAELDKAYKAFTDAPWSELPAETFLTKNMKGQGSRTKKEYEDALRLYLETLHPAFKKLEGTYDDLSQFLSEKVKVFEEDPKTKGFAPAVKTMADAAHKFTYAVAWGTVSTPQQVAFAEFIKQAEKIEEQWKQAKHDLSGMIERADKAVDKMKKKTPTASEYAAVWKQELRGIGAQIAMAGKGDEAVLVAFKDAMKSAATQWAQSNLPKGDKDVAEQVKKDVVLVGKFQQALSTI